MNANEWATLCFNAKILYGLDPAGVTKELLDNDPPLTPNSADAEEAARIIRTNHMGDIEEIIKALQQKGLM